MVVIRHLVTLVVTAGLLLSGCGDGDRPDAGPRQPPATSPSTGGTASNSPSAGATGVEPASGPLVEDDTFRFRLPGGAEWDLARGGFTATTYDDELNAFDVATSSLPMLAGGSEDDLDLDFDLSTDSSAYDPPQKRGRNRVVDGLEGWTAETVDNGRLIYTFGTMHARHSFGITFRFPEKDPRTLAWIEATLASIEWK